MKRLPPPLKRRDVLKMSAGALLAAGLWPGRLAAEDNGQSAWSFLWINDLHFKDAAMCGPWFETLIAALKTSAPEAEFCLLGGDLSDDATREQLSAVHGLFQKIGMPLHTTPGNHDHTEDGRREVYEELFAGQSNQVFLHRGWQFVGLDTTQGSAYHDTSIVPATFEWLDANLPKLDRQRPTILFTHFPLGADVKYRPLNADALLEKFLDFNLQAVFNGHWHGASEKPWHNALITTNRCCSRFRGNHDGSKLKGWFVCRVEAGRVSRQFVEIPEALRG